jgi:hypothetical protein
VGRVGSLCEPILIREYVWAFILQFGYAENTLQVKKILCGSHFHVNPDGVEAVSEQ